MAISQTHLFWDSCVFIAYLNDEKEIYDIASIEQYIEEARNGKHVIYTSTVALAEIRPSFLKLRPPLEQFNDFVEDMRGAIVLIDASPNLMTMAGRLKDFKYKKSNSPGRQLSTGDAIMLASCIYLMDAYGVKVDVFHTFDDGKRRGPDGKSVPLISYQDWCSGFELSELPSRIISLPRQKPSHPAPRLPHTP